MRSDSYIEQHPERNEIVKRLLSNDNMRQMAKDYNIPYPRLTYAKGKLKKSIADRMLASLPDAPPMSIKTTDAELISANVLISDLALIKERLNHEYLHTESGSIKISALDKQIRVVGEMIRMAELAERWQNKNIHRTPEYQRLERAIAATVRRHPEIEDTFNREYDKQAPRTHARENDVPDDDTSQQA